MVGGKHTREMLDASLPGSDTRTNVHHSRHNQFHSEVLDRGADEGEELGACSKMAVPARSL